MGLDPSLLLKTDFVVTVILCKHLTVSRLEAVRGVGRQLSFVKANCFLITTAANYFVFDKLRKLMMCPIICIIYGAMCILVSSVSGCEYKLCANVSSRMTAVPL